MQSSNRSSNQFTIDQIQKEANKLLSGESTEQLYKSVEGITRLLQAIIKTDGINWAAQVIDEEGNPLLTEEEQRRFTNLLEPFIPAILAFFKEGKHGGATLEIPPPPAYNNIQAPPSYNNQKQNAKAPPPYSNDKQNAKAPVNQQNANKNQGVDNLYESFYNKIAAINSKVNGYASHYGILKYEKDADQKYDLKVPAALRIEYPFLEPLYLPVRTAVYLIQLLVDVIRISVGLSGHDQARKILSIAASLLDLLRGDWKNSLLSLIGFYGTTPMLVGQLGKIYLSVFRTFSPTLQRRFTYGALDATKSFFVGLLLSIFQLTAPISKRKELIPIFQKIALKKKEIDGVLTDQDLLPRPDYMIPSFEDLNNLQVLLDDPVFICSTEAKALAEQVNQSSIINMVLQLLRIPVTEKMQQYTCPDGYKPIAVQMVKEGQRTNTLPQEPVKKGGRRTVRSSTWKA